jgi:hypothetical protein
MFDLRNGLSVQRLIGKFIRQLPEPLLLDSYFLCCQESDGRFLIRVLIALKSIWTMSCFDRTFVVFVLINAD